MLFSRRCSGLIVEKVRSWKKGLAVLLMAVVTVAASSQSQASQLEIHLSGFNFTYNGTDIFDAGGATGGSFNIAFADPLATMTFILDGIIVGTLDATEGQDIFADVMLISPSAIPITGGVFVGSNSNAFGIDLLTDTDTLLALNVGDYEGFFSSTGQFITVGGEAVLFSQNLPFLLEIDSLAINFVFSSTHLTNITTSGGFVTGFEASGTGSIITTGFIIPEPATAGLLFVGATTLLLRRRGSTR